jgi:hypothetical protein
VEINFNTKTRLQVMTWSLVFVLMLISIFMVKIQIFFFLLLKKDVLLLCAWPIRKKLEILSIKGGPKLKTM